MAIPRELLKATESRAAGFCVYGGPGMKKTLGVCTLPPPILLLDIGEGGTSSLLPWILRRKNSDEKAWTCYSDDDREIFMSLLDEDTRKTVPLSKTRGLVDIIHFDVTRPEAFEEYKEHLGNFNYGAYNSIAIDSLQEFSVSAQTFKKGDFFTAMNDIAFGWVGVQEMSGQHLRNLRNYRDKGIFVYFTAAEDIAKDYVKNPMARREKGESEPMPYSVRGTVQVPGALASAFSHLPDVLMHARILGNEIRWVTEPENLTGSSWHWDAKDRYGRLAKYEQPSFRSIMKKIYGDETYTKIYEYGLEGL